MPTHLPAFLATTFLLAMLPGPAQALIVRQTLLGGPRAAWATVVGNSAGQVLWSVAASAGLSAVLVANPRVYAALRIAGGVVLIAMGAFTLRGPRARGAEERTPARSWNAFAVGLGTNLGNPKAGVFAVSVLPQFASPSGSLLVSGGVLGATWGLVTLFWYALFTWAVGRGRTLMSRPALQRRLRLTTGGVLLVLGAAVVAGLL